MKIISHREYHAATCREVFYHWEGHPGWGFGFDCDETFTVNCNTLNIGAIDNYEMCLRGEAPDGRKIIGPICKSWEQNWHTPGIGLCEVCGHEVELEGFTCTCDNCGADYNSSGQRLASRECWGEETGEHPADIARIR